ncbi:hypothetical protein BO83DRAFT_377623 [Aspergillus eucalypticola CBS 122712]|uniref:Uncharacterized protein n=1 Tax=Aspergillus eucalypticola (strain CBS 122712 / IBT 29274) TaxID=1448314 RepID=A0A317VNL1_ASPEC|nr:uncharacterized protein BO83DRAFT_377623 [Aspergillus eucalypticola CBS 122712]PWY75916.1 hypothetical protein BO83DRAFT_377623 [Aspergillus eucalypticola CBS 122712]
MDWYKPLLIPTPDDDLVDQPLSRAGVFRLSPEQAICIKITAVIILDRRSSYTTPQCT